MDGILLEWLQGKKFSIDSLDCCMVCKNKWETQSNWYNGQVKQSAICKIFCEYCENRIDKLLAENLTELELAAEAIQIEFRLVTLEGKMEALYSHIKKQKGF